METGKRLSIWDYCLTSLVFFLQVEQPLKGGNNKTAAGRQSRRAAFGDITNVSIDQIRTS